MHLCVLGSGDIRSKDILTMIGNLVCDVIPHIMVVDCHIILEPLLIKFHPLILNLLVSICHMLGRDNVSLVIDKSLVSFH